MPDDDDLKYKESIKKSKRIIWGGIITFIIILITLQFANIFNRPKPPVEEPMDSIVEVVDSLVPADYVEEFEYNSPLGKCKYTGYVDENNLPNGKGIAKFSDGRYYDGEFVRGNLSGNDALFDYPNGDEFRGTFKDNAFYEGTYTIKEDGSHFVGTFKNGQPDKGKWYDRTGTIIE